MSSKDNQQNNDNEKKNSKDPSMIDPKNDANKNKVSEQKKKSFESPFLMTLQQAAELKIGDQLDHKCVHWDWFCLANRLTDISDGDPVDVIPLAAHPGWKNGNVWGHHEPSGQVTVQYKDDHGKKSSYGVHLDNEDEIDDFDAHIEEKKKIKLMIKEKRKLKRIRSKIENEKSKNDDHDDEPPNKSKS